MASLEMEVEHEIAAWRSFVASGPAVAGRDLDELEAHLRDQIADLRHSGLAPDEAFLIAVKRMGRVDEISHEFAREHTGRLWRQLVAVTGDDEGGSGGWRNAIAFAVGAAIAFAVGAAIAVQVARLVAGFPGDAPSWLARNASLLVLPFVAGWLAVRRELPLRGWLWSLAPFALGAVIVNVYPFDHGGATEILVATHIPVVGWLALLYAYSGGAPGSHGRRMDFVRFTGEFVIYYSLIAIGGGVLMALTTAVLAPTQVDVSLVSQWVLPSGAAGAVVVAAWLVESKQRVVENMAPVLTMLFTPLFTVMLLVAAVAYAFTGPGNAFDRELLGVFDALMVVVLGLVLYGISAREPSTRPGWSDHVRLVAVLAALALDLMVLAAMAARIGDLGFTPNRVAALGLNLVLLVNLAGTAWYIGRFVAGRSGFARIERWQTAYLPVFAVWAAIVVVVVPAVFSFE